MTREETVKIIRIMVDSYPNYKPNNISETVDVWQMMLSDYDYNLVAMALKAYILSDTSGFAPAIGQIVAKIQTFNKPQELSEMEAWSLVGKAIRNSAYNSVEEFAKLPPIIQKSVGMPDQLRIWATDENYNETVISSNFIKCYRTELKREEELSKLPGYVRKLVDNANANSCKTQMEERRERAIKCLSNEKQEQIGTSENEKTYDLIPEYIKAKLEELKSGKGAFDDDSKGV